MELYRAIWSEPTLVLGIIGVLGLSLAVALEVLNRLTPARPPTDEEP